MPRPRSLSRLVAALGALAASILPCHGDSAVARRQGEAESPLTLYYRDMEKSFLSRGQLRQDAGPTSLDPGFLSDSFREIALSREYGSKDAPLMRWEEPVRMAVRFHLMETILLPAIRAQTDPDFVLQITTSQLMPDIFQERLDRITADLPQVRILRSARTDLSKALRPAMAEASGGGAEPAVHFRVDDDDAVSADYIARLRRASARVEPGGMVTFPRGVMGFLHDGIARHAMIQKHSIAASLIPRCVSRWH